MSNSETKKDIKVNKVLRERIVRTLKALGFVAPVNYGLTVANKENSTFVVSPHNMSKEKVTKALRDEFGKNDERTVDHFTITPISGNRLEVNLELEYECIVNGEQYKNKTAHTPAKKPAAEKKTKRTVLDDSTDATQNGKAPATPSMPPLNGENVFSPAAIISGPLPKEEIKAKEEVRKAFARPILPLTVELLHNTIIRAGNMTLGEYLDNHCRLVSKGEINIYWTSNSNYRSQIAGNRIKKVNKIAAIKESYVVDGQLFSLSIFNEYLEEIDAQHRNDASFESELGIYFVIMPGYALPEVKVYNAILSAWTPTERMISFADEGDPNYILFREFFNRNSFNISACQLLLIGRRSRRLGKNKYAILDDEFMGGNFKVTEDQVAQADERVEKIKRFKLYHKLGWNSRDFVDAFLKLSAIEGFSFDELIGKFEQEPNTVLLNAKAQKSEFYIMELLKIYNEGRPKSKHLVYTGKK